MNTPPTHQAVSDAIQTALQQTAVIIPARNEEKSIGLVLSDLPDVGCVIVANNGSTDATADIARRHGCVVIDVPIAGYGRACLSGMNELQERVEQNSRKESQKESHKELKLGALDIRYVGFIDADYSDHPQELVLSLIHI